MSTPKVFLSYARDDKDLVHSLVKHLNVCEKGDRCKLWWDHHLQGGDNWEKIILEELAQADLTLFFVTARFLASHFINTVELPEALRHAKERGMTIVPIIATACYWEMVADLARLNVRPVGGKPLWDKTGRDDDEALKGIAMDVVNLLAERSRNKIPATGTPKEPSEKMTAVWSLPLHTRALHFWFMDEKNRLWLSDYQQVHIFSLLQATATHSWVLHDRSWKCHLTGLWQGHLVLSDWRGCVFAFPEQGGDHPPELKLPGHNETPVHRLATGPDGRLVAAAWDGSIWAWNAPGQPASRLLQIEELPQTLIPLRDGWLALTDDSACLRLFDPSGVESWRWQADQPIGQCWACEDAERRIFIAQVGLGSLVKVTVGGTAQPETQVFPTPIVAFSHCGEQAATEWTAVARLAGLVDWVPENPFRTLQGRGASVPQPIDSIFALKDRSQANRFIAVGRTTEGSLFTTDEGGAKLYSSTETLHDILPDQTGRFIYVHTGDRIELHHNPSMLKQKHRMEKHHLEGRLSPESRNLITIQLINKGSFPIPFFEAELLGDGLDATQPVSPVSMLDARLLPIPLDGVVTLQFSVRAKEKGLLPLKLHLHFHDEVGFSQGECEVPFTIESSISNDPSKPA